MNNTASRHCNLANLHFGQRSFRPNCLVVSANLAGHFSQPVWSHRLRSVIIELRRKQQIFKIGSKSVSQSLIRGFWLEYSVVQARCKVQVSCSSSDNEDCYLSQLKWSLWTIRAWKCPAAALAAARKFLTRMIRRKFVIIPQEIFGIFWHIPNYQVIFLFYIHSICNKIVCDCLFIWMTPFHHFTIFIQCKYRMTQENLTF